MPRRILPLLLLVVLILVAGRTFAQEPEQSTTTLKVQSQLVLVPTMVQTSKGEPIYELTADKFILEDNGVRQQVRLDDSGAIEPLSLVVAVQCSRTAWTEMDKMRGLSTMVDAIIGGAPAEMAVIQFGTGEDLISKFVSDPDKRESALGRLAPCEDGGNTIYDAVEYATQIFEAHKAKGRRVVLLVSETRDHGSETKAEKVVEELGRSNVVVDAVAFSPFRDEQVNAAQYKGPSSILNPISLVYTVIQALRANAPKELARLSGGEYINFATQKGFDKSLVYLANHVNNYYMLSFQPRFPADAEGSQLAQPGLHTIKVTVPDYPSAKIRYRQSYWAEGPAPASNIPK